MMRNYLISLTYPNILGVTLVCLGRYQDMDWNSFVGVRLFFMNETTINGFYRPKATEYRIDLLNKC